MQWIVQTALEGLIETTTYINSKKAEQAQLIQIQNEISAASPLVLLLLLFVFSPSPLLFALIAELSYSGRSWRLSVD